MNQKNKIIITGLAILVGLVATGYGYTKLSSITENARTEYSELLAESSVLDLQIKNANKVNSELKSISDIKDVIPSILPPDKIQSDIVAQVLNNANSQGLIINALSFPSSDGQDFSTSQTEPLEGVNGVSKIPITLDFESSFSQLISFIDTIEKNQRIAQIEQISINPDSQTQNLIVALTINVYVRTP